MCYFLQDDHATALHMVAVFGFHPIATLLIEYGGDLNVKTHAEHTPLHRLKFHQLFISFLFRLAWW